MNYQVPNNTRLEIKFVAYDIHRHRLLQWMTLNAAAFRVSYPERWVNNVYFDTHGYTAFKDNLMGASSRRKVRYRWYGDSLTPVAGNLEIKCKRNTFGWKMRYNVDRVPVDPDAKWTAIRLALREQLAPEVRSAFDANPFPVLINRYCRRYFVSADGKIRATIDTQQTVLDQRRQARPNLVRKANLPRTFVVEFKCDRGDRKLVSRVLRGIPLRVGRHSKYINGVQAILGY